MDRDRKRLRDGMNRFGSSRFRRQPDGTIIGRTGKSTSNCSFVPIETDSSTNIYMYANVPLNHLGASRIPLPTSQVPIRKESRQKLVGDKALLRFCLLFSHSTTSRMVTSILVSFSDGLIVEMFPRKQSEQEYVHGIRFLGGLTLSWLVSELLCV